MSEYVNPDTGQTIRIQSVSEAIEKARNAVWAQVIKACAAGGKNSWGQSPTEMIVDIINERDEARAEIERLKADLEETVTADAVHLAAAAARTSALKVELGEIKLVLESQDLRLEKFKAAKDAAESQRDAIRAVLEEVRTNGEWTEGDQRGEWKISKEVYEMVCEAAFSAPPAEKPHQTEARAGADDYAAAMGRVDGHEAEYLARHFPAKERTTQESVMQELTDEGQRINPEAYGGAKP